MTLISAAWVAALRERAAQPGLAAARRALDEQAGACRAWLPAVPEQQAGYYHNFFCPEHAVQLVFDPHSPARHTCPVDGAAFSGEPFDSAWLWSVNDMLSDAALKLACHAILGGKQAAAERERAADILTGYASRYRSLPRAAGQQPQYPGWATWSGLDESVWVIRLAWAYALLENSLPEEGRQTIAAGLLRPAAAHIAAVARRDIHNIANWNNAALATLALVLDDTALLEEATEGSHGLRAQLAQGVRDDGFWYEGSPSYHYYALAAIIWQVRALRSAGRAFNDGGVVQHMLRAPLDLAFPDLSLPAIHDCWYDISLLGQVGHGIPEAAGFLEVAYAWYGDPAFAWALGENYARRPRLAFEALLDGVSAVPEAPAPTRASWRAAGSGLAILRSDEPADRQTMLILKAGPARFSHGHPDQLAIQLFSHGQRLSVDLGTPGYGIGLHESWYRHTASHNTALVDGRPQPLADGYIERFDPGAGGLTEACVSWQDGDYTGVRMSRRILWRPGYFVDVFTVDCPTPRQVDWLYHNRGRLVAHPNLPPPTTLAEQAYTHITDVRRLQQRRAVRLAWQVGDAWLDLLLNPLPGGELLLGKAPANPASESQTMVMRRRTGTHAVFVAVFAPRAARSGSYVGTVDWRDLTAGRLAVETRAGRDCWDLARGLLVS